jgi:hypothetical protein
VRGAIVELLHDLEQDVLDLYRDYAKLAVSDGVEVVTTRRWCDDSACCYAACGREGLSWYAPEVEGERS